MLALNRTLFSGLLKSSRCTHLPRLEPCKSILQKQFQNLSTRTRKINLPFAKNGQRSFQNSNQTDSPNKFKLIVKYFVFSQAFGVTMFYAASNFKLNIDRPKNFPVSNNPIANFWNQQSACNKVAIGIIFINTLVFLAWRSKSAHVFMLNNFLMNPLSGKLSQTVLSAWSHTGFFHLGFNMLALYSMSNLVQFVLTPEQFLAFYISAGVNSSCVGSIAKLLLSRFNHFSLGASGGVVAIFSLCALAFPTNKFYIFPIPYPIEASNLLKFLFAFDLLGTFGIYGNFIRLDHFGHIGGYLSGWLLFKLLHYRHQKTLIERSKRK